MSKERYGIRRFALLNTAGYSLGLFPLEEPLSVYGANNLGKSASINALQFPILARMSDMSFGKYTLEQSRRFYFATDTSYILVEVSLPHGPHVIGVVGARHSYNFISLAQTHHTHTAAIAALHVDVGYMHANNDAV